LVDTPRIGPDGLVLEPSFTNLLSGSFALDATTDNWTINGGWTISAVNSLFVGESAYLHVNDNAGVDRLRGQTTGTLSATPETVIVVYEEVDATQMDFGLRDNTTSQWVALTRFDFSTTTSTDTKAGSDHMHGAVKLADIGPNGGRVWFLWSTATPANSGNTRKIFVYPVDRDLSNSESAILHAVACIDGAFPFWPIDGSMAGELMYWDRMPAPQAMAIYHRGLAGGEGNNGEGLPRVWSAHSGSNPTAPDIGLQWNSTTDLRARFENGTDAEVTADVTLTPTRGDLIETVVVLESDGTLRLKARKNGGAVSAANSSTPASGLPSAHWFSDKLTLGGTSNGVARGSNYHQATKIVKLSALSSATTGEDENLMAELAGALLLSDGSISNVIL